jgi:hypothetical protein
MWKCTQADPDRHEALPEFLILNLKRKGASPPLSDLTQINASGACTKYEFLTGRLAPLRYKR